MGIDAINLGNNTITVGVKKAHCDAGVFIVMQQVYQVLLMQRLLTIFHHIFDYKQITAMPGLKIVK